SGFFVAWNDARDAAYDPYAPFNSDIYGARVSNTGEVADPNGIAICTAPYEQFFPAATSDGTNFFVVWADQRNSPFPTNSSDIYGAQISSAGVVQQPGGIAISTAISVQSAPAIAFNGSEFVAVWVDSRNTPSYYEYPYYTDI